MRLQLLRHVSCAQFSVCRASGREEPALSVVETLQPSVKGRIARIWKEAAMVLLEGPCKATKDLCCGQDTKWASRNEEVQL
jgi:hypothetical protein